MEGPGKVTFKDGWMHMRSPGEKMHHVFWCPKRFPESFVAQWEAQNLETDAGLCIVFFAAAAKEDGGSIFDEDLPERDGTFSQYTKGAIRCYHASYYANAAHNPDRQQTNLRKNPGFHLVAEGPEGIPTKSEKPHTLTLAKHGNHIRLWIDQKKVIDWTDEGEQGGKPHGDGYIGLRQMKWTHFRYRNFTVWEAGEADATKAKEGAAADAQAKAQARSVHLPEVPRVVPPVFDIPRLDGVTIDGEDDDWADDGFAIDLLHRHRGEDRWQPRSGADVRLGWDPTGLLVRVRLEDDRWVEGEKHLWKYDGLELYAAPHRGSPQHYQLVIAPGMSEKHDKLRYDLHDHRKDKAGKLKVEVARTADDGACVIEARLPWANLGMTPGGGEIAAFQLLINDNDEPGSAYGKTSHDAWFRQVGTFQDSARMHTVRLAEEAGPAYRAAASLQVGYGKPPKAVVDGTADLAGDTLVAATDEDAVGRATMRPSDAAPVSRGEVALADTDANSVALQVGGQAIATVTLYQGVDSEVRQRIKAAGNAESEQQRYRILKELRERRDLPPQLREDLATLMPVVDWWANGREKAIKGTGGRAAENGYLCRFFYPDVKPNNDWPGKVSADSPLYPIRAYYRGRALLWVPIQIGGIRRDEDRREQYYRPARKLLKIAHEAYPENEVIAMYNGEPIAWEPDFEPDPNAPRWANLQREGLEKLADVIHWWIDHRQIDDGQYGGGWGDDVEMWRWWTPLLVGFDDPKIVAAQKKLSNAILSEPHMRKGYTSHLSDVEHTAEDTGDSITPMIFLEPDERAWRTRALRIIELADEVWMGENERGFLQFKSTWFSVDKVDLAPKRACDTVYHPRTFHPALIHWLRSGDDAVGKLIARWMDTWVDATARAENGKPAGVTPSAIHWPDGEVGGGVEPWWKPQNYRNDLYAWPSAMDMMIRTMLLTYHMTGDEKYLTPIQSMAAIRLKYLQNPPDGEPTPGSAAWCALVGKNGGGMARFLPATLSKYRLLTRDGQFDELLKADADGYMKMRLGQGRDALVADLEQNAEAFGINKPAYTSEMRWTDRVLTFNHRWGNEGNAWDWPTPNTSALYASATGDPGDPRYFPMNAVRWLIEPRAFAALVTESGQHAFAAELYNFRDTQRKVPAELYLLATGDYVLTLTGPDGEETRQALRVEGTRTRIELELPPRTLCRLTVRPK